MQKEIDISISYHRMMAHVLCPVDGQLIAQNKLEKFHCVGKKLDALVASSQLNSDQIDQLMAVGRSAYYKEIDNMKH